MSTVSAVASTIDLERLEGFKVKVSRIEPYADQPRRTFDQTALETLADSIQTDGQQLAIKICRLPKNKLFTIVDGERRWRAHQIIWKRTGNEPTIDAILQKIENPLHHFRASVIANLHREDLSDLDEAAALALLKRQGETYQSLANMTGKSTTYIQNYIRVDSLPSAVKELMSESRPRSSRLSITAAIDVATATKDPGLQLEIALECTQSNLSLVATRELLQKKTGVKGYASLNLERSNHDQYRMLTRFLQTSNAKLRDLTDIDFESLYFSRENELGDRKYDMAKIDSSITECKAILERLSNVKKTPYQTLTVFQVQELLDNFKMLRREIDISNENVNP